MNVHVWMVILKRIKIANLAIILAKLVPIQIPINAYNVKQVITEYKELFSPNVFARTVTLKIIKIANRVITLV